MIKALSIEPDIGTKALNVGSVHHSDTVNLADDRPELLFGPEVGGQTNNGVMAPFYISLNIHDLILHTTAFGSNSDGAFDAIATFYCWKTDKPRTPSNVVFPMT